MRMDVDLIAAKAAERHSGLPWAQDVYAGSRLRQSAGDSEDANTSPMRERKNRKRADDKDPQGSPGDLRAGISLPNQCAATPMASSVNSIALLPGE